MSDECDTIRGRWWGHKFRPVFGSKTVVEENADGSAHSRSDRTLEYEECRYCRAKRAPTGFPRSAQVSRTDDFNEATGSVPDRWRAA